MSAQLQGKASLEPECVGGGFGPRGNWARPFMRDTSGEGVCKGRLGAPVRATALRIGVAVAAIAWFLGGCSSGPDSSFSLFAEPGKYEYHSCDQIAGQIKFYAGREQELKTLMDRAEQSAGGTAVGLIAYKADYVAAGEELDLLRATAHSKKCDEAASWRSDTAIR
jgi:hypothetical protein